MLKFHSATAFSRLNSKEGHDTMTQKYRYPQVRPATDVVALEDGIQITANMPGVDEQNLQVMLEGKLLHITASSRCPVPAGKKDVRALEFGNVDFALDIVMDDSCSAPVKTSLHNGVLSVFLPRGDGPVTDMPVDIRQRV